jgi:hypothetical protein
MRSEPHETQIILQNIISFYLRWAISRGERQESVVGSIDDGQLYGLRGYAALQLCEVRSRLCDRTRARSYAADRRKAQEQP